MSIKSSLNNTQLKTVIKPSNDLYIINKSFSSKQRYHHYFIFTWEQHFSHSYKSTSHVYSVTKICGATILQTHFVRALQNLLWGSNTGSNDKKDTANEYFMHLYTKRHKWTKWCIYESIFGQVKHNLIIKCRAQIKTKYENSYI